MARGRDARIMQEKKTTTWTVVLTMLFTLTLVVLVPLGLGILSLPMSEDQDSLVNDLITSYRRMGIGRRDGGGSRKKGEQWTETLSWEPRTFLYHHFLSEEECDYLISQAKPYMAKSIVEDVETGLGVESSGRTSTGMFLRRGQDKIIRNIEKRIADFSFIPVEHGEGLQVIHYEVGQKYDPHYDFLSKEFNIEYGGQRTATFVMYLSDVEEGGETVFPDAKVNISSVPWWNELSECAKQGLAVKPKMGDALLFWSTLPDATPDPSSFHGSCPVIRGNKWAATKLMHLGEYED